MNRVEVAGLVGSHSTLPRILKMIITPRSSNDQVISNACELVVLQETEIKVLKSQQTTLFYLLGGLTVITLE